MLTRKIRIIGGKWKRRKLTVLNKSGLRPTTNQAKEMLFNWLTPYIFQSSCLDCFAGSGALGIEALSRHASNVTFLEIERNIAYQLKLNLDTLGILDSKVININTLVYLAKPSRSYNVIFIDPPFYSGLVEKTLILLEQNKWLDNNAIIYVEGEVENNRSLQVPIYWNLYRKKIIGKIIYILYYRKL